MVGDVVGLDDGSVADLIAATRRRAVVAETELLVLAGIWGHRFEADPDRPAGADRAGRGAVPVGVRDLGGSGSPAVNVDAVIEFGTLTHATTTSASNLIADALDLEHRLPRLWGRVCAGEVVAWQARKIAKVTRHLSRTAAGYVDRAVVDYAASLPWGRLRALVEAKVVEADPARAEARAAAAAERFVRTGRTTEQGLKTIFARVDAGNAIWFVAAVDRIAAILAEDGDTDPVDVRRSKAIGVLADPAMAAQLMATHQRPAPATRQRDMAPNTGSGGLVPAGDASACAGPGDVADDPVADADADSDRLGPDSDIAGQDSVAAGRDGCRVGTDYRRAEPVGGPRMSPFPSEAEDAWPRTDPWERHRWIPDAMW